MADDSNGRNFRHSRHATRREILASGAALGTQVSAAAAYTLVGLAFAEIPLICHLAAPARTGATMSRVHDWVQARRRAVLGIVVAVLGVFLMTTGLGHV